MHNLMNAEARLNCPVRNPDKHRRKRLDKIKVCTTPEWKCVFQPGAGRFRSVQIDLRAVAQAGNAVPLRVPTVVFTDSSYSWAMNTKQKRNTDLCPWDANAITGETVQLHGKPIIVGTLIGEGSFRRVYNCNYSDGTYPGRQYVLKKAKNTEGLTDNRHEQWLYDNSRITSYIPRFAGVSECGEWLLVEKCITAEELGRTSRAVYALCEAAQQSFPGEFRHDLRPANWGVTEFRNKVVKLDIAPYGRGLIQIASLLGIPNKSIKAYAKENNIA